jgi:putative Holliday junction resolvase
MIIKSINHFKNDTFRNKKILSIDYGQKKLGFSHSNLDQTISFPLKSYRRKDLETDLVSIKNIILSLNIDIIVLGLPVSPDNKASKSSQQVKSFARVLQDAFDLDIFFWDERFSTVQAQKFLKSQGFSGVEADEKDDMLASQIILDSFLNYRLKS